MKILAVDTSAVCASAAVCENEKIISLCQTNTSLTHSRTLLPMIDSLLKNSETSLQSIDFLACSVGPGSFTGIRIGIAALKGLADGLSKKCLPVSTLQALAYNLLGNDCIACAVMDARCNQVYTALFDVNQNSVTRLTEDEAIKIEDLGKKLAMLDEKVVFVGDGAEICHKALGYNIASPLLRYQNAASVCICASRNYKEENLLSANSLMPVYLRLPQAERELKKKEQTNSLQNK